MLRNPRLRISVTLVLSALALPPLALANSGGAGLWTDQGATPAQTATVSGAGITLAGRTAALLGGQLHLSGAVAGARGGRTVVIERQLGSSWSQVASATTAPDGSFTATWTAAQLGTVALRARMASGSGAVAASGPAVTPALTTTVYRPAIATFYGPGFWGHRTACGATLRRSTLGVANRKLACGTKVSIYYHGMTITVPVIDRGPYANGANWDLTEATASALGMNQTAKIGAVAVAQ
jgi:hypothetical protein